MEKEINGSDTQSSNNMKERVESGEGPDFEELTLQDKLRDAMSKIKTLQMVNKKHESRNKTLADRNRNLWDRNSKLEALNKTLADQNRNLCDTNSKFEALNKTLGDLFDAKSIVEAHNMILPEQLTTLERRVDDVPAVPNEVTGVPCGGANDMARDFRSSDRSKSRPLESQFARLNLEDLDDFMKKFCEMEKQLKEQEAKIEELIDDYRHVRSEKDRLLTINKNLEAEKEKLIDANRNLDAENDSLASDSIKWIFENMTPSFEELKRKFDDGKVPANGDEDRNYSAEDGENYDQEKEINGSDTYFSNNMKEPVESGENPDFGKLTVRDAMSKIETLEKVNKKHEALNKTLADQNRNPRDRNSNLKALNKTLVDQNWNLFDDCSTVEARNMILLPEQITTLEKRVDESVPNEETGVPYGGANDVARDFRSSDRSNSRPLESQFARLNLEDLEKKLKEQEAKIEELNDDCRHVRSEKDTLLTSNKILEAEKEKLIGDKKSLKAEKESLTTYNINLTFESMTASLKKLERKFGDGKVPANGDEDRNYSAEDGENSNQEKPRELLEFFNPFNCDVCCSPSVLLFILYYMGLRLCFRRLLVYLQCSLSNKHPGAKFKVGKCSSSLVDFYEAGLIESQEPDGKTITGECTIDDALRDARKELKGQSDPALLAMEYEKNPDGTKPVGHSVVMMPDGKYIDVKEMRYWEPTSDSRISHIYVINVKRSELAKWQRNCGIQNCAYECIVRSVQSSNDSLG